MTSAMIDAKNDPIDDAKTESQENTAYATILVLSGILMTGFLHYAVKPEAIYKVQAYVAFLGVLMTTMIYLRLAHNDFLRGKREIKAEEARALQAAFDEALRRFDNIYEPSERQYDRFIRVATTLRHRHPGVQHMIIDAYQEVDERYNNPAVPSVFMFLEELRRIDAHPGWPSRDWAEKRYGPDAVASQET